MYLNGFGNYHQTEAMPDALPKKQNSPQHCAKGLYAEQLSGSAFTRPRHINLRSWLYRLLPSVTQGPYLPYTQPIIKPYFSEPDPNPLRWFPLADDDLIHNDFIDGLFHVAGHQTVKTWVYHCSQSMHHRYFANNDGELLFVPYQGEICLHTELGLITIKPGMIAVIPRGIHFKLTLNGHEAKGYLCENQGMPLALPPLGAIGSNGLANPRHFEYPTAAFEPTKNQVTLICKHHEKLWTASSHHSPLNVVAWHGNYAPYRYDLSLFNTINTVSFDHPDPSIFTVLTSESDTPGVANLDFVIFPPRWMVADHTFRPPYFHRNYMSELMGLISGEYDAKKDGFLPGGISIHNGMVPHGPDLASYTENASKTLKPEYYSDTLAFMFETKNHWIPTIEAMEHPKKQNNYTQCWAGFKPALLS